MIRRTDDLAGQHDLDRRCEVLITGGGTAGHTNPGIAVADALVVDGVSAEDILFIGAERGSDRDLVSGAGYRFIGLPGRGIPRKLSKLFFQASWQLAKGIIVGFRHTLASKPRVVLCLGGYASLAASLTAVVLRYPIVVSEQNARASATNKLIGRFAKKSALPFPSTDLPRAIITGNPIRSSIGRPSPKQRADAREHYGILGDTKFVCVWSGSLGAQSVNDGAIELARSFEHRSDVSVRLITGSRFLADYEKFETEIRNLVVKGYENHMDRLLAACDLAVCRSGASTVAELAVVGVPSILVPLPGAPRDHQVANTAELAEIGGAKVVADDGQLSERLVEVTTSILDSRQELLEMAAAARRVGRPRAAADVAQMLRSIGGV